MSTRNIDLFIQKTISKFPNFLRIPYDAIEDVFHLVKGDDIVYKEKIITKYSVCGVIRFLSEHVEDPHLVTAADIITACKNKINFREGKGVSTKSVIDLDYFICMLGNNEYTIKKYNEYCKNKTNKMIKATQSTGAYSHDLKTYIRLYGQERGKQKHENYRAAQKNASLRTVSGWMRKGFSEEEARIKLKEHQTNFSKQICIEKYGKEKGIKIWRDRQDRWQDTLNSKPQEEIDEFNKKKAQNIENFILRYGKEKGLQKFKKWLEKVGSIIPNDINEIKDNILFGIQQSPYDVYKGIGFIKSKYIKDYYKYFITMPENIDAWIHSFVTFIESSNIFFTNQRSTGSYHKIVEGKLLRSSHEICFYDLLISKGLVYNKDFLIDIKYDNSNMRDDFYIIPLDLHIEIAGLMGNIKYENKMHYKEKEFGARIIIPNEINSSVERIVKELENLHSFSR